MDPLPDGFADALARVIEPREHEAVAEIVEAATMLDDEGLRRFMRLFAQRVAGSEAPVSADELRKFLERAARGAR